MTPPYRIEALQKEHDRKNFHSGSAPLDRYFAEQVTQDIRRRLTACFVALDVSAEAVAGYYTFAAASLPLTDVSPGIAKNLPRYPLLPAVRVGRLAVDQGHRGKGLGAALVVDAIKRTLRSEIVAFSLIVDAKDETATSFYEHLGFQTFQSVPGSMYLPLTGIALK